MLEEESEHWSQELLWDYTDVSSAVASALNCASRRVNAGSASEPSSRASTRKESVCPDFAWKR